MLITYTGPLVALLNGKDKHHAACADLFRRYRRPIIIPAPVVPEVVAVAERLGITKVATIDREHFHTVKSLHSDAFELLPASLVVEKRPHKAKRGDDTKR
jgi:predicted nucleic acid-binding protein